MQICFFFMNAFFEEFVDCVITSLVNFFFDYDQIILDFLCRDFIEFITFNELMRIIILSRKVINSITKFVRIIIKILNNHISKKIIFFVNDLRIKDFKIIYNNEYMKYFMYNDESILIIDVKVHRYISKHI